MFVPFIAVALLEDSPMRGYVAAGLFILASLTDWIDGWMARKYKVESNFGKFLDPVTDKILVTSTLIMMVPFKDVHPVLVVSLLARDTLVGGFRSLAATKNIVISAGTLGKWKTIVQMVAIPAALIETPLLFLPSWEIGFYGLWLSVILSMVSGAQYVWGFRQVLAESL
jgi:CDP-diacylglycerol--glycerol-3-phosphate 3-phosphatidyltransferase